MGKIAEIKNSDQERAFDLIREPDALYLSIKCSDSSAKNHSKIVVIKLSDVLYQVWRNMTSHEKKRACNHMKKLIAADRETA